MTNTMSLVVEFKESEEIPFCFKFKKENIDIDIC